MLAKSAITIVQITMFVNQRSAQLVVVIRMLIGLIDIFASRIRQKVRNDMTGEEAREFLIFISHTLGNMSIEYLTEKDGEKMRNAIKALEQPKWIPVGEGLPEKDMACLVAVGKFNLTQIAMYSDLMGIINHRIFYQGDYGNDNFENITQYVKAWMPLPEPYKAQESEE